MSREVNGKRGAAKVVPSTISEMDRGQTLSVQKEIQSIAQYNQQGADDSFEDHVDAHKKLALAIRDHDTSVVKSLVIKSKTDLPIEFAGAWTPLTDTGNAALQPIFGRCRDKEDVLFFDEPAQSSVQF